MGGKDIKERQQYWLTRMRRRLMALRLLKKTLRKQPKHLNTQPLNHTSTWRSFCCPDTQVLPRQLLGNTVTQGRSQVSAPYSKYKMLIRWFRQEPIRHDLHLKTAVSHATGNVCLKSVNKYRREGRKRRRMWLLQKKKKEVCHDWKPAVTGYTLSNSFGF